VVLEGKNQPKAKKRGKNKAEKKSFGPLTRREKSLRKGGIQCWVELSLKLETEEKP